MTLGRGEGDPEEEGKRDGEAVRRAGGRGPGGCELEFTRGRARWGGVLEDWAPLVGEPAER